MHTEQSLNRLPSLSVVHSVFLGPSKALSHTGCSGHFIYASKATLRLVKHITQGQRQALPRTTFCTHSPPAFLGFFWTKYSLLISSTRQLSGAVISNSHHRRSGSIKSSLRMSSPYNSLKGTDHFRVVDVYPGKIGEEIHCTLRTVSPHDKPQYEAVSYTWGNQDHTKKILLNGVAFDVTENCEQFLQYFRYEIEQRPCGLIPSVSARKTCTNRATRCP
ncbi:hypothetical protein EJ06DRAFT_304642 [Trichodelitschia bisporula]|uniref:Uncharacterized protein n=1 Tax=Trichodelitschia bisporula TaxID=703511 RepID=A0A6G1HI18_9PEZI|nr:hypothetical protein EJ06DRAFT_304642 [Trichodelitschia bisporula]